ncbi:MAG TPA: hypothetical protein VMS96_13515 [Terriglobales bacterium]|nr:hypothetical protein [Terriglobales bacterium]
MLQQRGRYAAAWLWVAIAAIVLAPIGCSRSSKQEQTVPSGPTGEISGTITLDPALKDKVGKAPLLLIFASTSSDPTQPALVVKREFDVSFPYNYKLSAEDITLVGSSFQGKMYVTARIDPAGMIGPARPGTFDGTYPGNPVAVGSSKVDIVINKAH